LVSGWAFTFSLELTKPLTSGAAAWIKGLVGLISPKTKSSRRVARVVAEVLRHLTT